MEVNDEAIDPAAGELPSTEAPEGDRGERGLDPGVARRVGMLDVTMRRLALEIASGRRERADRIYADALAMAVDTPEAVRFAQRPLADVLGERAAEAYGAKFRARTVAEAVAVPRKLLEGAAKERRLNWLGSRDRLLAAAVAEVARLEAVLAEREAATP